MTFWGETGKDRKTRGWAERHETFYKWGKAKIKDLFCAGETQEDDVIRKSESPI